MRRDVRDWGLIFAFLLILGSGMFWLFVHIAQFVDWALGLVSR